MESLGFVILTWNSEKVIENCLNSISGLSGYNIHVIVVDNGSSDNTCDLLSKRELFQNTNIVFELIRLESNKGTTISRNIGISRLMENDWICILDSDTVINQKAIDQMIFDLKERKENGIVGPRMITSSGLVQNSGRRVPTIGEKICKVLPVKKAREHSLRYEKYEGIEKNDIVPVGYLMSACWMVKKEVIDTIGLLDEKIFYAPEDVEFCIRAWKAGYRVLFDGRISIIHEWQRLSRKKLISKHNWEHIKGLFYMYSKHKFVFSANKLEKLVR